MNIVKVGRIKYVDNKGKSHYTYRYKSHCITCGEDIFSQKASFAGHSGRCKSCTQKGEPYAHIYNEAKKEAERRGLEFTLDYLTFVTIISTAKCHYCDEPLVYHKWSKSKNGSGLSRAYQLDRKDNNRGYTANNIVPCCWTCNRMKSDSFSYTEFLSLAEGLKRIMKQRKLGEGME